MRFILAILLAVALAPFASGQQKASAELFARQVGDQVQAAVKIEIEPKWYLYHTELGPKPKEVIGMPLKFTWADSDVIWGEPVMPAHKQGQVDDEFIGTYAYYYHTGSITVWFQGEGEAELEDLQLTISGQTCSSVTGSCILFSANDMTPSSSVPAGLWASAPAMAAPGTPEIVQGGAGGFLPSDGQLQVQKGGNVFGWKPNFDLVPVDMRYRVLTDGEKVHGIIEFDVKEGYHAYAGPTLADISPLNPVAIPTTVEFLDTAVAWGDPVYPQPTDYHGTDDNGKEIPIKVHSGTWRLVTEGLLDDPDGLDDLTVIVGGQVCDDEGCFNFPGEELEAIVEEVDVLPALPGVTVSPAGPDGAAPAEGDEGSGKKELSLWAFLGQAVFWGVFTLLMPCTYPMIPITISFFTKQATARGGRVWPLALTYGLGIITIFVLIGLLAGPVIQEFAQHPITNIVIGLLFLYFALTLFGVINLQPPQFMNSLAGKAAMKGGYLGVFLMGTTLVVTSFTCTAPFVGTILASGATSGGDDGGVLRTVLGMGTFGLVMATPFVLLSLLPAKMQKMPQAGGWMNTLKVFMGFVEVAMALKFFSNADVFWQWNIINNQVFLLIWVAVFAAAGIYLIYQTVKSGSKSRLQTMIGVLTLIFAGFLGTYLNGRPAGEIMTAFLPGYHHEGLVKAFGDKRQYIRHEVVYDNFEEAFALAQAQGKSVLINFTGET